nr:MAG TPA: SOS-response transcriptional repressor [Caudoviricetes sp.]
MNVSLPTIAKWEIESGELRMKQALKLCKLYKKNIDDIFFED